MTIYNSPKDFPGMFVARLPVVEKGVETPTEDTIASKNIEEIREIFRNNRKIVVERHPCDDPSIVETWL